MASLGSVRYAESLRNRLSLPPQPNGRSTLHLLGKTMKSWTASARLTISRCISASGAATPPRSPDRQPPHHPPESSYAPPEPPAAQRLRRRGNPCFRIGHRGLAPSRAGPLAAVTPTALRHPSVSPRLGRVRPLPWVARSTPWSPPRA